MALPVLGVLQCMLLDRQKQKVCSSLLDQFLPSCKKLKCAKTTMLSGRLTSLFCVLLLQDSLFVSVPFWTALV